MCTQRDSMQLVRDAACLLSAACHGPLDPAIAPFVAFQDALSAEPVPEIFGELLDHLD